MTYDFAVIGGGWAGLLSANELKNKFPNSKIIVLEACMEHKLGGLLHSEKVNGLTFDTGGPHILFSRNKEILEKNLSYLGNNVYSKQRKGAIFFENAFIDYPFENGIFSLEPERRVNIAIGIINCLLRLKSDPGWTPSNFYEWIYGFFGEEMGKTYLEPYNQKIWKRDLKKIDADWVFAPGRLPFPNLEDLVRAVAGIETTGYKEQAIFSYPKVGGIQAMFDSLLGIVKLKGIEYVSGTPVSIIKSLNTGFLINDSIECKKIVNTIALPEFLGFLGLDEILQRFGKMFDYNSVVVVGVGFEGNGDDQHAVYVPEANINFHRYTWMSNLTTDTPRGKSNLIAETTVPFGKELDPEKIVESTIEGLEGIGILNGKRKVIFKKAWVNRYGYPIYVKEHTKMRNELMESLHEMGILSVGRWGSWQYWNTDKVHEAVLTEMDFAGDI